jgi:hypothetical protein
MKSAHRILSQKRVFPKIMDRTTTAAVYDIYITILQITNFR